MTPARALLSGLLVAALAPTAGCSMLFARRPAPLPAPPPAESDCDFTKAMMITDIGMAAATLGLGLGSFYYALFNWERPSPTFAPETYRLRSRTMLLGSAVLLASTAPLIVSAAASGGPKLRACRRAQAATLQALTPAPALPTLARPR